MDDTQLLQKTQQLIAITSTSDQPQALQEAVNVLADLAAKTPGVTIEQFEQAGKPSFLAYYGKKRPDRFKVLLNGHVDVVPGKPEQFVPRQEGGKLYGRGALDMKTAALVLTEVFCGLAPAVPYALGLQVVADEEIGGTNGTGYQVAEVAAAEFVIAGEFTPAGAICNESRGICWLEVEFTGEAAHSAYLWNGRNALLAATTFIDKLLAAYPIPSDDTWTTTANVASISTPNTTMNRVPDTATVRLDIRYVAEDARFANKDTMLAFIQSLDPDARITVVEFEPSHHADPNSTYLKALSKVVEKQTGTAATLIKKHGASDVRYYSARGDQAVVIGLQGEGLHSDGEYVEVDSIGRYRAILTDFLQSI